MPKKRKLAVLTGVGASVAAVAAGASVYVGAAGAEPAHSTARGDDLGVRAAEKDKREPPAEKKPGANAERDEYLRIANLDNRSFIRLRDAVSAGDLTGVDQVQMKLLQASLASDRCPAEPPKSLRKAVSGLSSQQIVNGCLQHDFRYTVGPTVFKRDASAGLAERAAADNQLASLFNVALQQLIQLGLSFLGGGAGLVPNLGQGSQGAAGVSIGGPGFG
uniref:hypothetical protein n=1 Tax=Streptomyces sp. NBC_00060 TaxID=2975636 RepID=UPI002F90BE43